MDGGYGGGMVDWGKVREDFPVTKDKVYFISAGMSPIPNCVFERYVKEYKMVNEYGDIFWEEDVERYYDFRKRLGRMINALADDLAILHNTSTAMSVLALSLKNNIKEDFNIVSMTDEFPSTTVPFEYQGISVKYVEPIKGRYPVEKVLEEIDDKTKAVVTSHVQYCTGFRQNIEKLGQETKKRGILFILNATQAFPFFHFDVEKAGIDAATVSFHKWGLAGHVGALFYTSKKFREEFKSPIAGWLSVVPDEGDFILTKKNSKIKLLDSADRYIFGCVNFQSIHALETAFDYMERIGFENIQKRIFELTDYLIGKLREKGINIISPVEKTAERSAIVTFVLKKQNAEFVKYLETKNIFISYRKGNLRASVNIFNNYNDIDMLTAELENFL